MVILINVLVAAWLGGAARQTQASPAVGFVVTVRGPWQIDLRDVKLGQGVGPGAHIVLASSARFDTGEQYSLQVVLLNNTTVGCPSAAFPDCRRGVTIEGTLNQRTSAFAKLRDVFALIFESPDRWVGLVSRDVGRVNLADTVVQYDRGRVAIGQVLGAIPAGEYAVRWTPVADAGQPGRREATVQVSWTGDAKASVAAPLGPGLYRVVLLRKGSTSMVGREAWMLIASSSQAPALRASFDAAVAATRAWEPAIPRIDVERFLHAYLAELAPRK